VIIFFLQELLTFKEAMEVSSACLVILILLMRTILTL